MNSVYKLITYAILLLTVELSFAGEIRVAVASNFTHTIKALAELFEQQNHHKVKLIFGASGRHYAQIKNGAPFDIFLSADSKRPEQLEADKLILKDSRFTYAIGKLVLWSPDNKLIETDAKVLEQGSFSHIAIANHKLAPYGKAAYEFLNKRKLWDKLKTRVVRGENIAQTFQFIKSGNAQLGFVALSQTKHFDKNNTGSLWRIPESMYQPIKQQAVLLKNTPANNSFIKFLQGNTAKKVILNAGYGLPND